MSGRPIRRACDLTGCSHGAHGAGPVHIPGAIERRSKQGGSCSRRREGSHGSSSPARGAHAVARRRHGVAELATVDDRAAARPCGRRGLLDLHLHQLAAHTPVRTGVGTGVRERRPRRHRRAHPRVRHRARRRQRPPCGEGDAPRVPDRRRQRLRGLGGVREPLLAGPLLRRRERRDPPSPLRRG